ncbi:hypothetical protein [Alteribacillus sp. HJP-4]|uniref:hypothetical protein n=1 Tax=Alteribacillus sp. HJP-4 TaxID=2775394 RepID=UPI0035CD1DDB
MAKDWMSHPWIEKFLPDHLRPVDDHIFSDAHGLVIIKEMETALDRLIEYGKQVKSAQTFKKNGKTFHFRLKINQKRMKLLCFETPQSEAAIKKRITIDYVRKAYQPKNRSHRIKEATVQYIKNGQTFVRSIQKSTYFQNVFYKLEMLDEVLIGSLINRRPEIAETSPTAPARQEDKDLVQSSEEPFNYMKNINYQLNNEWKQIGSLLENRLNRLLEETHRLGLLYDLLDVEERYTVKRMLNNDIPSLINTYLSLAEEQQKTQTEHVYEALTKMEISVRATREAAEHTKLEKMEQLLQLNEKRYSGKRKNKLL